MDRRSSACPHTAEETLAYWLAADPRPGEFVYVVQAGDDPPIKVGRAVDVRKRIAGLQTGNPRPFFLLAVIPGGAELEWQLHHRLRDDRLIGEWFDGAAVVDFVAFARRLMVRMAEGHIQTGEVADYRRFETGWAHRRFDGTVSTVSFVEPDPEAVARAEAQRTRTPGPYRAPERDQARFAHLQGEPTFQPHKRR